MTPAGTPQPEEWFKLAAAAAKRAKVLDNLRDDAIGAVLEDYSRYPPRTHAEAVGRGTYRAIDFVRSWTGHRHGRPEAVSLGSLEVDYLAEVSAGDDRIALVEWLDYIDDAGLTPTELEAFVACVVGVPGAELDAANGNAFGASAVSLGRARRKLRSGL